MPAASAPAVSPSRPTSASAPLGPARGPGDSDPPETPREAAEQFEHALVRQFVQVMTKDLFSQSHAGQGGGNWMESQRGRQRDLMTDMIADRLADAETLDVAETLIRKWGGGSADAAASSSAAPSVPAAPDASGTYPAPSSSSHEPSRIDHAA